MSGGRWSFPSRRSPRARCRRTASPTGRAGAPIDRHIAQDDRRSAGFDRSALIRLSPSRTQMLVRTTLSWEPAHIRPLPRAERGGRARDEAFVEGKADTGDGAARRGTAARAPDAPTCPTPSSRRLRCMIGGSASESFQAAPRRAGKSRRSAAVASRHSATHPNRCCLRRQNLAALAKRSSVCRISTSAKRIEKGGRETGGRHRTPSCARGKNGADELGYSLTACGCAGTL